MAHFGQTDRVFYRGFEIMCHNIAELLRQTVCLAQTFLRFLFRRDVERNPYMLCQRSISVPLKTRIATAQPDLRAIFGVVATFMHDMVVPTYMRD